MLFNSYEYILFFLPVSVVIYHWLTTRNHEVAVLWLVIASLFFYGWWNPIYLSLIAGSITINYGIGVLLGRSRPQQNSGYRKSLLVGGIAFNLVVLAYFKYAGFLVTNINALLDTNVSAGSIILPLAISFFTFQQIAYLVDSYQRITSEYRFLDYALFVTFFPQLIAGPIVHHKEMLPQFEQRTSTEGVYRHVTIGATIFAIGLFKKAVLADGVAIYATPVFDAASSGAQLDFFEAWRGALAYTCQLYFDFSGYSDMAIGAARMFGIRLPLNFHSPYKATSIVEFWRRWHMTLSRFLRDYLYIPLGGSKRGKSRRQMNLLITMILGGLWHGAGWTFVAWGALHGVFLMINHSWVYLRLNNSELRYIRFRLPKFIAWSLTFSAVVIGWVFFRATSFEAALRILEGMAGLNGVSLPNAILSRLGSIAGLAQKLGVESRLGQGGEFIFGFSWIAILLGVALLLPNTQEIMRRYRPSLNRHINPAASTIAPFRSLAARMVWTPSLRWAAITSIIATLGILALTNVSEFLYFQF